MAIGNNEIRSLTGIRGMFAMYVMFYHIKPFAASSVFLLNGYLSVDLFFILSGFILSHVYESRFSNGVKYQDYLLYLINRAIRVYPLYFFALLVVSVYLLAMHSYASLIYEITVNFLFIQSIAGAAIIGPTWSLSTEVIAYLLMPLMIFCCRNKILLLIFVYVAVGMLGFLAYPRGDGGFGLDVYTGWQAIARCLSGYVLGSLSYCIYTKISNKNNNFLCLVMSLLIFLMFFYKGFDLFIVVSFSLLIPLVASSNGIVSKFLSCRPVYYIGEISYSIYIWHSIVSRQFNEYFTSMSTFFGFNNSLLFMVLMSLIISVVTYHLIEVPCKRILKSKTSRLVIAQ